MKTDKMVKREANRSAEPKTQKSGAAQRIAVPPRREKQGKSPRQALSPFTSAKENSAVTLSLPFT